MSEVTMDKESKSPSSPLTDFLSEFLALDAPGKGADRQNGRLERTSLSRPGVNGLERLNKLLGVMERMEELREANQQLQHKCAFLEDTKMLLKVQNIQLLMEQSAEEYSRRKRRSKTGQRKGSSLNVRPLPGGHRRNSADARRSSLVKMHQQRSQSVSSICELVDLDLGRIENGTGSAEKPGEPETQKEPRKSRMSEERRSLKLQEKWKQVKKVFSGKSESVSRGAEHGAVSAELLLKTNSRRASRSSQQSLNKSRSCSVSGDCSALQPNQSILLSPPIKQRVLLDEESSSLRTPSIVLAESPQLCRSNSQQVSSITSDPLPKSNCSEIPEEVTAVRSPGDDSDDSAFTPWVQQTPKRRQSSPLMSVSQPPGSATTNGLLSVDSPSVHLLGRSSSFKVTKTAPEVAGDDTASKSLPSTPVQPTQTSTDSNTQLGQTLLLPDAVGRKTKGPWGMVKGIIQTRRESLKSKNGKGDDDLDDSKEESIQDNLTDLGPTPGVTGTFTRTPRKLISRKLSVTPNLPMRFAFFKNAADTSPLPSVPTTSGGKRYSLSSTAMSPGSPMDLATLFGVNDDFTKKMQEWEEKKKKIITKGSPLTSNITAISGSTKFSEDFIRKMEEWEQKKGLGGSKPVVGTDGASSCRMSPEGSGNPLSPPPPTGDEVQRFLSESFSRTVQDWEEVRRRHSQSKEREKSKKVRSVSRERDKSQQRLEKQLKKIQKKEQKLEQELRKLSELRLKIDHQLETSSTSEKAPTDRRISQEGLKIDGWSFPRSEDQSTKGSVDTPKSKNSRFKKESLSYTRGRDEAQGLSDGACTAPVSPSTGSGRHQSASLSQSSLDSLSSEGSQSLGNAELTRSRDGSLGRCRRSHSDRQSSSSYRRTQSSPGSGLRFKGKAQLQENDALTRRTEEQLRRRVEEKEDEVAALQNEVHQLTNQINNLNKVYSETIDQFQRDLWSSNRLQGQQQVIQSDEVSIILSQLTNRLDLLQQHGDRMAKELSQTQTKICKEANNRRQTEQQLLHNLEQLHWIIESPTASSSLAEVVLHLCSYLTKLLSKASVLRQCISERNLLIQELERHLLVQEVINKLLHADIERHAIELSHLKEFQRLAVIKRWKTFNGSDHLGREEQTSEMSKSHEPVFPKIPQSSKKVQALLTQMVNDPDSLDIDTDWLTTIKKDAELALNLVTRGIQTDCFIALPSRSRDTTNASVQTVMTFCDCDYVPAQLPSPSTPFRRVASTSSSSHPPLFITPSCNSPSSSRNVIPVDKCFLFPGIYAQDCDMNYVNSYKPRKSSAPEISTDDGENPVWLRSSAFRAISSSYSERIQDLDGQLQDKDSKVHQSSAPVSSVNGTNASLVNVPSAKSVKNLNNDANPQESGVGNTMSVSIKSPYKETLSQPHSNKEITKQEDSPLNLTIVDKLSTSSAHSPMIQSKCPWKQKRANTRSNECQEGEGRVPKTSPARPSFMQSRSCNTDRFIDDEAEKEDPNGVGPGGEGPGEEDTDVVFSSSEDAFCWNGNVARLRETQIDGSFDIPEGQEDQDGSTTPRHSISQTQSVDQRRAGSWSGSQDPEKRGTSINRPIVVRKLKSATELMHDCRKKRSRAASVSDERYNSPYTKNAPDTATKDQQKNAGRGHFPPTDALSQSSFDSAGFERRRSEDSRNGSSGGGSDAEKCPCNADLSPVVSSEGAPPAISKDCNRFKPITPVFKSTARGQQTVKSVMVESSSETIDLATSGYQPMSSSTYQQRSCTSSCSSIPTVEMNFISTAPLSNRNRGVYAKENAPESPAAPAGGRGSRKGSRSQPGLSPRAGSRAARSMCRALCLQAMSVELTDDSTDSSLSHPFTPHASSTPSPYPYSAPIQSTSAPVQSTEQEPEFHHKGRGNWLHKPKKLFKALK